MWYTARMIPHTAPPFWSETRLGRFAAAVHRNSDELRDNTRAAAAKCSVALLGIPDDTGVGLNHGRVGAREGPHAFRAALARYGSAIPMAWGAAREGGGAGGTPPPPPLTSLPYPRVFDAGDIIPGQDIHETHQRVTEAVGAILDLGLFPIAIGGGHDLTFPFVRGLAARTPGMHGVYLDAHLDVREEVGSGMPFRKLIDECAVGRLTVVGLSPLVNSEEHFLWFAEHGGRVEFPPPQPPHSSAPPSLTDSHPKFVSIDMDAIDQSCAPGVSATNPAGLMPGVAEAYAYAAGASSAVKCFDIMELNPTYDEHGRTARLAAHLFLSFLRGFAERR